MRHPFLAELENALSAKLAAGGTFSIPDLLHQLVKLAQQAIDTPEERKGISDAVMSFYDAHLNSLVPDVFRDRTRAFVQDTVNAALVAAAGA